MLNNYFKYIKESVTSIIKPDPPGYSKVLDDKIDLGQEYEKEIKKEMSVIYEKVAIRMAEKLKGILVDRFISIKNETGHTKFIYVTDIGIENTKEVYYPVFFDNKGFFGEKIKYAYNFDKTKSKIFFLDSYMNFFEKNFLNQMISFSGISIKSRKEGKFLRHITKLGLNRDKKSNDYILIGDDKGNTYILNYDNPIKIHDEKIKEIDPYGEENWEE